VTVRRVVAVTGGGSSVVVVGVIRVGRVREVEETRCVGSGHVTLRLRISRGVPGSYYWVRLVVELKIRSRSRGEERGKNRSKRVTGEARKDQFCVTST